MEEYHNSIKALSLCVDNTYLTVCPLKIFFSLRASNYRFLFNHWTHFTNHFPLFTPLNHMSAFFISSLFSFFLGIFSSLSQIAHLFHQINVAHNIKDRYCIVLFVIIDGVSSIADWIIDKINLFSHFNKLTVEIAL